MSDQAPDTLPPGQQYSDAEKTRQLWGGSMAAATGLAMLALLHDQIRSRRRKRQAEEGAAAGPTVTLRMPPQGYKTAYLVQLASAGAVGAGTYYLWNKVFNEVRKRQLEKELEQADSDYTQALQEKEAPPPVAAKPSRKVAHEKQAWPNPVDISRDVLWLSALAAGAGSYGLLENAFPKVSENPKAGKPRKIVIKGFGTVLADGPGNGPLAQLDKAKGREMVDEELAREHAEKARDHQVPMLEMAKAAALDATTEVGLQDHRYSAEMLTLLLSEFPALRKSSSALIGLVGVNHQDPAALKRIVGEAGLEAAIGLSKSGWATFDSLTRPEKQAAIHEAFANPLLNPTLALLAVAELGEVHPQMAKRACVLAADPEMSTLLTKFAAMFYQAESLEAYEDLPEKSAAVSNLHRDMRKALGTLTLSEPVDAGGEMDETDPVYSGESAGQQDPIDQFLSGDKAKIPQQA